MKFVIALVFLGCAISMAVAKTTESSATKVGGSGKVNVKAKADVNVKLWISIAAKLKKGEKLSSEEQECVREYAKKHGGKIRIHIDSIINGKVKANVIPEITTEVTKATASVKVAQSVGADVDLIIGCVKSFKEGNGKYPECQKIKISPKLLIKIALDIFKGDKAIVDLVVKARKGLSVYVSAKIVAKIGDIIANLNLDDLVDLLGESKAQTLVASFSDIMDILNGVGLGGLTDVTKQTLSAALDVLATVLSAIILLLCTALKTLGPLVANTLIKVLGQLVGSGITPVVKAACSLLSTVTKMVETLVGLVEKVMSITGSLGGALGGIGGGGASTPKPKKTYPPQPQNPYPTPEQPKNY